MSRIFDALQQSKAEGDGYELPLISSLVAEVPKTMKMTEEIEVEVPDLDTNYMANFRSVAISPPPDGRLVSLTDQASLGAEKFRLLGVRLRQLRQTRSLKTVLITSTIPEEGKSTVSANLAVTLAQRRQQKVLLLEGDLRRPSLGEKFGIRDSLPGLSEWLQSDLGAITNIYHLQEAGFWFLPAGGQSENNLELVQSERLSRLMNQLTDMFDWILIDSPPIAPLADTSVWMRMADGILLVVREGTTRKRQLQSGLRGMEQARLLGMVLNSSTNTDHDHYYQRYVSLSLRLAAKSRADKQRAA